MKKFLTVTLALLLVSSSFAFLDTSLENFTKEVKDRQSGKTNPVKTAVQSQKRQPDVYKSFLYSLKNPDNNINQRIESAET